MKPKVTVDLLESVIADALQYGELLSRNVPTDGAEVNKASVKFVKFQPPSRPDQMQLQSSYEL
jgi:hypothetical protein